jgi:hypothetical protein
MKTSYKVVYQYKFNEYSEDYVKFFEDENKSFQFLYTIIDRDVTNLNLCLSYDLTIYETVMLIDSFMKTVNPSNFYILSKTTIHYAV